MPQRIRLTGKPATLNLSAPKSGQEPKKQPKPVKVKYIRDEKKMPIGVVLALDKDHISWSMCHRVDEWNAERARGIAIGRALRAGSLMGCISSASDTIFKQVSMDPKKGLIVPHPDHRDRVVKALLDMHREMAQHAYKKTTTKTKAA